MNKVLIEVSSKTIGSKAVQSVLARELYLGLGLSSINWSSWSDVNIVENSFFAENVDWMRFFGNKNPTNGVPIKDFIVSIDFAKHISMMAKTEKAHKYRNYFIECESQVNKPLSQLDILVQSVLTLQAQDIRISANEAKVELIEAKLSDIAVDLRNGVPHGFISKSNAHKMYSTGLSKDVFELVMLKYGVVTHSYLHQAEGYSTVTFGYQENQIVDAVTDFIKNSIQTTPKQCYSVFLNKRFYYIKNAA